MSLIRYGCVVSSDEVAYHAEGQIETDVSQSSVSTGRFKVVKLIKLIDILELPA